MLILTEGVHSLAVYLQFPAINWDRNFPPSFSGWSEWSVYFPRLRGASRLIKRFAQITSVFVFLLWALVTGATIRGVVLGRVFDTPGPKALGSDEESCQDSSEGVEDIEKAD